MSTWTEFYNQIRDSAWPDCEQEDQFSKLPKHVQQECCDIFGYVPGAFKKQSKLINKIFPIKTATSCQLKWNWSTIYLATERTSSCCNATQHQFDTETFDFHNTPTKMQDRQHMLDGQWPDYGCESCIDIEQAGGQSERMTKSNFPGMHAPPELDQNLNAVAVTPRILEVYFDNTCNLKCLYCGPYFSSLWDAENIRHGAEAFNKSKNIESNKQKIFAWLKQHGHNLTNFNILGGEPLYQDELDQCLDLFDQYPAPELKLQIITNLNAKLSRVQDLVARVKQLIDQNKLREFEITASLDCWGPEQEYVRYPLNLEVWQKNFEYLLDQPWINLIINSTVTPLTVKTLPELLQKINQWSTVRKIYHYQSSVNGPSYMFIDIFGDIFHDDFAQTLVLKPNGTPEEQLSRQYLQGIAQQSAHSGVNVPEIKKLFNFLNENDRRRGTSWPVVFPWLVNEFAKYDLNIHS